MIYSKQLITALVVTLGFCTSISSQDNNVDLINEVIADLIGEQDNPDIPVFKKESHLCRSSYISCNKRGKIIGLNFQFSNLNGHIPESISKLEDLVYINLEYNYLTGSIPSGLAELQRLEELSFRGNFLTGPIPEDLVNMKGSIDIDLSENVIKIEDKKLERKMNIVDQVNLEGCRSPDSIYLSKHINQRLTPEDIIVDTAGIETQKITEPSSEHPDSLTKVVETMPRFPGCEDQDLEPEERERCAQQKMLEFIYRNLRYPSFDRKKELEGMVVTQFVVLEDGSIGDVTIVKAPRGRMGNSGLWVINRMNYICDKWVPGSQAGKNVKVLYTLPINFKLQ